MENLNKNFGFESGIDFYGDETHFTDLDKKVLELVKDGQLILNPHFNLITDTQKHMLEDGTKKEIPVIDILNTAEECDDRFYYVESIEIDVAKQTMTCSNGDGWEFVIEYKDIMGTAMTDYHKLKVILAKGTWIEDEE